ncbi:MAG: cob(I)yrinic acid a,c-diamide adenosyltransferase [Aestuariivita sp.]|nr:cob(I)yrinic acid a,c-diamide adenosyltransferase [Aestuariivita sp.]MCY4346897.1 cob(I)yrinic acid a,c-diamide adenosyltransferase [Aestuariivita sp.]
MAHNGEAFTRDTRDRERDTTIAQATLSKAGDYHQSVDYALIVLDEINIAVRRDCSGVADSMTAPEERSDKTSVILKSPDAKPEI